MDTAAVPRNVFEARIAREEFVAAARAEWPAATVARRTILLRRLAEVNADLRRLEGDLERTRQDLVLRCLRHRDPSPRHWADR